MKFRSLSIIGVALLVLHLAACSEKTSSTSRLPDDVATVGIQVKSPIRRLKTNQKIELPISIVNNGTAAIPSEGKEDGKFKVNATYHWLREGGESVVWDGLRTPLSKDILKGNDLEMLLALQAPGEPGRYILVIDLVQEGAVWFEQTGSQTARMLFTIEN